MKLRLSIVVGDNVVAFEHPGPVVSIGRDPECELCLEGEASDAVSRRHARIDLTDQGATVSDTGSSNGTLLNGRPLKESSPLRVGDQIQMGYTGAILNVLELDLAPKRTGLRPPSRMLAVGSISACLLFLVLATAGIFLWKRAPATEELVTSDRPAVAVTPPQVEKVAAPPSSDPLAERPRASTPRQTPTLAAAPDAAADSASEEEKEVGTYVVHEHWVSVLVQRRGEGYPWTVLRPDARIVTGNTLVSLPGYKSVVGFDSGLELILWGNLPEFSPAPPLLESAVLVHSPPAGFDGDLALDRGRIVIANRKAGGAAARLRLRFLREIWDVELPDAGSAVGIERWSRLDQEHTGTTAACVGLFSQGRVRLKTPRETLDLGDAARVSWVSQNAGQLYRTQLSQRPDWWTRAPDEKSPEVKKALRSLLDWRDILGGDAESKSTAQSSKDVVGAIKTQVDEIRDPDNQDVGIFFLAALDAIEPLIGCLKDRQNPNVRGVTLLAMQSWLGQSDRRGTELAHKLERGGDPKDRAERIVRLLHFYPPQALNQRKTYEELVAYLDDEDLLVRNLAFWHLDRIGVAGLLPEEAKKIPYDPAWDPERRHAGVEQWKRLIADGKVPASAGHEAR